MCSMNGNVKNSSMTPFQFSDEPLEKALIGWLRNALASRYSLENIRRYSGFDAMSDASIAALRAFGLDHIYPEWETRCFQDEAFEKMMALLANPLRLSPLTAVALKSLFRFGRNLPKAIDAGKQVITAFEATRTLEEQLLEHIRIVKIRSEVQKDIDHAASLGMAAIGKPRFESFVESLVSLMELLNQRALLTTGISVLQDIAAAMEKRPESYDEIELAGAHYAVKVMTEGIALFDTLDPESVSDAIQAIPDVEHDWFDAVVKSLEK